jgi:hypothetical protein
MKPKTSNPWFWFKPEILVYAFICVHVLPFVANIVVVSAKFPLPLMVA